MERRKFRRLQTEMARANQVTVQRRAEEARRELEQDMQILQEAIEATKGEAEAVLAEKRRMAKEMLLYQKYMEEVRAYEREREQNIDMFHRAESDKVRATSSFFLCHSNVWWRCGPVLLLYVAVKVIPFRTVHLIRSSAKLCLVR